MKKSKKLSLQSLALVLMSFILVAGVAFGMTGAWFQDKDTAESEKITMGKGVYTELSVESGSFTLTNSRAGATDAMPGDKYTAGTAITVTNGSESTSKMYLFVSVTVEGNEDLKGVTDVAISGTQVGTSSWYRFDVDAKDAESELVTLFAADDAIVTIPTTWENDKASTDTEAKEITITINVVGIQQANVDVNSIDADALDAAVASAEAKLEADAIA